MEIRVTDGLVETGEQVHFVNLLDGAIISGNIKPLNYRGNDCYTLEKCTFLITKDVAEQYIFKDIRKAQMCHKLKRN
jgi:hypothetical protein